MKKVALTLAALFALSSVAFADDHHATETGTPTTTEGTATTDAAPKKTAKKKKKGATKKAHKDHATTENTEHGTTAPATTETEGAAKHEGDAQH